MFKKKIWALILCLMLTPNLSLASAKPKLAANYDQQHSHVWSAGENLKIKWQVFEFSDEQLLKAHKTLGVINETGTFCYVLPAGDFNIQRSGTYNWVIPKDIVPGKYKLLFDLIIPGTWPYQAESPYFQISQTSRGVDG